MTKKIKISFLFLIWSIVGIQFYVNSMDQSILKQKSWLHNKQKVVTTFSESNEETEFKVINGYGYFGCMQIDDTTKEQMLINLANKLGINDAYDLSTQDGMDYTKKILSKKGKYANTTLEMVSRKESNVDPEQYIFIQIETRQGISVVCRLYEKVIHTYKQIGIDHPNVNLEMSVEKYGDYGKDLSKKKDFTQQLMKDLRAKTCCCKQSDVLDCVYGYSSQFENYHYIEDKKYNVQVTFSYDENQDKTYIKVGVPFVNSSY